MDLVDRPGDLDRVRQEWDALAERSLRPYSTPAWTLNWWESCRPKGTRLRVAVVQDPKRTIGVVPLYKDGADYLLLAADVSAPVTPVWAAGREREVAAATARALASTRPRPCLLRLALQTDEPDWQALLSETWPGSTPWHRVESSEPRPYVSIEGSDDWLASRSRNFRQWARRRARQLENAGGTYRLATVATVKRDVGELMRLHFSRHGQRSSLKAPGIEQMLVAAGRELIPRDRFRLVVIELNGIAISAQLFVAAGGEVSYWNGGFDQAYAEYSPSMLGLLRAASDAAERGEHRLDLGAGGQQYKYRMATGADRLVSHALVPHGPSFLRGRTRVSMRFGARAVRHRVEPVKAFVRRGRLSKEVSDGAVR